MEVEENNHYKNYLLRRRIRDKILRENKIRKNMTEDEIKQREEYLKNKKERIELRKYKLNNPKKRLTNQELDEKKQRQKEKAKERYLLNKENKKNNLKI